MSTDIKVKDAMLKKVVISTADTTVADIARQMTKEDVGSVIICKGTKPIGIVTREDIVTKIVAKIEDPRKTKANHIMNSPVITVGQEADLAEASRKMNQYGYERLPVVDKKGHLTGILSVREILKIAPTEIEILRERLKIAGAPEEL